MKNKNIKFRKIKLKNHNATLIAIPLSFTVGVILSLGILFLVTSKYAQLAWWENLLFSIGAGILSSLIVSLFIELYNIYVDKLNRVIFNRYFAIVYSHSLWYVYKIYVHCARIHNNNLSLKNCLTEINYLIGNTPIKIILENISNMVDVTDNKLQELIEKFAQRKFKLHKNLIKVFIDYCKCYDKLKKALKNEIIIYVSKSEKILINIEDYDKIIEQRENFEMIINNFINLYINYVSDINILYDYFNKKYFEIVEVDFSTAENYVKKWVEYDHTLAIMLDENDYKEINEKD